MTVEEKIKSFIVEKFLHGSAPAYLNAETPLFEHEIIDSLGIIELIKYIEESFPIRIEGDEVVYENFETIGAIRTLVENKI